MAIDGPAKKHGTCRLPDFLWGPSIRRICSTQDLRCVLLQRISVFKIMMFALMIQNLHPYCKSQVPFVESSKIEFTFSALSSAQLLIGHYNVNIKIRLSIVSQIVCFEMDFQCFHAMRFSEIFQELSSLLCILANIGQDSLSWDLRLRQWNGSIFNFPLIFTKTTFFLKTCRFADFLQCVRKPQLSLDLSS